MTDIPETPHDPKNRFGKEFEDPHYHDDDVLSVDDGQPRAVSPPSGQKPARRIPPPKRRFFED